jgi:hypothetical protein
MNACVSARMTYKQDVAASSSIADSCTGIKGPGAAAYATLATVGTASISGLGAYAIANVVLNFTPFGIEADTATAVSTVFGFGGFIGGGLGTRNALCSGGSAPEPLSP